MNFTARLEIKDCEPIHGGLPYVLFSCDLLYNGETVTDSGVWCGDEDEAVAYALENLTRDAKVIRERENYDPAEFKFTKNPWNQTVREDPEQIERIKKIRKEAGL